MALKVFEQSAQVKAMATDWPIVAALIGGTKAMRAAGEAYLPKWPNEEADSYATRKETATLFPAFSRTLGVMAGKPFSKALTLGEDVPPQIAEWMEDCDLEGRNLHTFSSEMMEEILGFGLAGVLVDYPKVGPIRTLAEERNIGARPYFVKIEHGQILGWKAKRVNGAMKLTQLRIAESAEVDDGDYGVKTVERVRVLTPGAWELWEKTDKGEYVLADEGTTSLTEIPFVPFYGRRTGFMTGVSPLLNLAYLNVQHWQDSSDQQKSVKFARVRMAAIIGADQADSEITVGADYFMKLPQGSDIKIVQGSAESVKVGREELDKLEEQMIQTGAELLIAQPGNRTATEANNDAEANKSELQRIVESFEDSIDQCLQFAADWIKQSDGGKVSVFKDFAAGSLSEAAGQLILAFQQGGLITKRTALNQAQRIGILSPDINVDEELEAVAEEGPALGMIGNGDS